MNRAVLYKLIVSKTGKPDYLAIDLYLDIKSQIERNKESILKTSYAHLRKKRPYSQEQIRQKFVKLEGLGLIQRTFTEEISPSGCKLNNVLNLSLKGVAE